MTMPTDRTHKIFAWLACHTFSTPMRHLYHMYFTNQAFYLHRWVSRYMVCLTTSSVMLECASWLLRSDYFDTILNVLDLFSVAFWRWDVMLRLAGSNALPCKNRLEFPSWTRHYHDTNYEYDSLSGSSDNSQRVHWSTSIYKHNASCTNSSLSSHWPHQYYPPQPHPSPAPFHSCALYVSLPSSHALTREFYLCLR